MKIYMAAQFRRRDELAGLVPALEAAGHACTSDWLRQATPLDGKMTNHTEADNAMFATRDLEDIDAADALLFFSEDPLVGVPRAARHVEFGYAFARGKWLAVCGPRENVFHWLLPDAHVHASFDAFTAALAAGGAFWKGAASRPYARDLGAGR